MSSLAFMLIEKDLNLELSLQVIYYRKTAIEKTLKGIISKAERQATHANTKKKMEKSKICGVEIFFKTMWRLNNILLN